MVEYVPPPKDLSGLNAIQRYMQKGSLDYSDYLRLVAILLAYWFLRPYIQSTFKRWSGETQAGEEEQEAYKERRAAVNDMRSSQKVKDGRTLGQLLEEGPEGLAASSGADAAATPAKGTDMKNRKKAKSVSFAAEKSEVEKRVDWEDESELDVQVKTTSTAGEAGEKNDIKAWMEKWTS